MRYKVAASQTTTLHKVFLPLYCALVLGGAVYSFVRPIWNTDIIPYMGLAVVSETGRVEDGYAAAYEAIKIAPPRDYERITGGEYHESMRRDPEHFAQQFAFYSIKPLYVIAVHSVWRMGAPLYVAPRMVSIAAYLLTALLVWQWIGIHSREGWRFLAATLLILSPANLLLSRLATPDALSVLIGLTGLFLIVEKEMYILGVGILMASIWVRTDNIILLGLVLLALLYSRKLTFPIAGLIALLGLASYLVINHVAGAYPLTTLYYHSFVAPLGAPADAHVTFTPRLYIHQVFLGARSLSAIVFLFYTLLGIIGTALAKDPILRASAFAVLVTGPLHYMLFPNPSARYYEMGFLFLGIVFVTEIQSEMTTKRMQRRSGNQVAAKLAS
jgi:hypothetical protein